jgi:plastocyanin
MTPRWILIAALALGSVSAHAETVRITIDKLVFAPIEVTAKVGDTIEWVNNDILAHTATATNKDWDVVIAPKKTGKLVLTKAGSIEYFCKYHPNMKGRLVVSP